MEVTDGGTLTWTRGTASEAITAEGETTLMFEADTDQTLAFAYTGTGKAEIWGLKQEIGSLLIIR